MAVRGDQNSGRCRFSAILVPVQYHFLRRLVYVFHGAENRYQICTKSVAVAEKSVQQRELFAILR
jgi:hypothetical protein